MIRKARVGLVATSIILLIGQPLELYVGRSVPFLPSWPPIMAFIVAAAALIITMLYRNRLTFNQISIMYLINISAVACSILVRSPFYAEYIPNWVPFQTGKLGCLVVALTAPNFIVGLIGILLNAGSSVVSLILFPSVVRENIGFGEPIPLLAFAMAGLLALIFRSRQMKLELELHRSLAEAEAMKSLTEAFVQLRDMMNTPLQIIELSIELLKDKDGKNKEVLDKVHNSLEELTQLNKILTKYEKRIDWHREPDFFNQDRKDNHNGPNP